MKKILRISLIKIGLIFFAAISCEQTIAAEGAVPKGMAHLDHVFVIMMENHGYAQIRHNPNAPFINQWADSANLATHYFAVGHPSLTNYLEVVGGSNFGVLADNYPDWHNLTCTSNLAKGKPIMEKDKGELVCPIAGVGTDADTPVVDSVNEENAEVNIDGIKSIPAATDIQAKTIADQLVASGHSWKTYQESLPAEGADRVNASDGFFSNTTDFAKIKPTLNPPLSLNNMVELYGVKHNPFAYFKNVQEGKDAQNSLRNSVGFEGANGFYADIARASIANFSFIAPNQCNDQHGRNNAGAFCNYDPAKGGDQNSLNPALLLRGDQTVKHLVEAIKQSTLWRKGNNAIILLWDENDYSALPNTNQVMLIVDTNRGKHGLQSAQYYNHFSLLRSLEAGFGLSCLNHACDRDTDVMADLFVFDKK